MVAGTDPATSLTGEWSARPVMHQFLERGQSWHARRSNSSVWCFTHTPIINVDGGGVQQHA